MHNKSVLIQSALNYTGGKYKLLPQILPLFAKKYNRFVDLFAGGACVSASIIAQNPDTYCLINDIDFHVIEFYKYLYKKNIDEIIYDIEERIQFYGLSNTKKYGYEFYNISSKDGLNNLNKYAYKRIKEDYNNKPDPILFYMLVVFGFNNQIRYNKKGEFNLPAGKRDFNTSMERKLRIFTSTLQKSHHVTFSSSNFLEIAPIAGDFFYVDPPYLISTATYNENGKWTTRNEIELYDYLDNLNAQGIPFAFSNVLIHKGRKNELLIDWSKKYQTHILNFNYNNSNYQTTAKDNETIEVLITNYDTKE